METARHMARLGEYQTLILQDLARAAMLVEGDRHVAREAVAKARWTLIRLLREYQLFKHGEIFDRAIASGDAHQVEVAERMKERCLAAGEAFSAHVRRWSAVDVAGRWEEYRAAVLAMVALLRQHVERERDEIERLLARAIPSRVEGVAGGMR